MGKCFGIDPATLDVVAPINGTSPSMSSSFGALVLQTHCHFNESVIDPAMGSNLHKLDSFSANPTALLAADIRRSYSVLEKAGMISDVQVEVTKIDDGRYSIEASSKDTETGQIVDLYAQSKGF
jgi:hypothetical protein